MKKLIGGGLAAATATGALLFGAVPAQAESFIGCGYGAGIATSVTSCEFAQNVRYAWFHQPGRIIEAYSPVTGQYYTMYCDPNTPRAWTPAGCTTRSTARAATTPWW